MDFLPARRSCLAGTGGRYGAPCHDAHGMGPEPEDPNWLIMFVPLMEQLLDALD